MYLVTTREGVYFDSYKSVLLMALSVIGSFLLLCSVARASAFTEWPAQFGTAGVDHVYDMVTIGTDMYVVGSVAGALPGQSHAGGLDAFVQKYNKDGVLQWTRQFGTSADDAATAIAVRNGEIYVTGYVDGALPELTSAGGRDIFLRAYRSEGELVMNKQLGSDGHDHPWNIAFLDTYLYIVGGTNAEFSGATTHGGQDIFVMQYHYGGEPGWVRQFGTDQIDSALGIAADTSGLYVIGSTNGTFPGQISNGAQDAYVMKLNEAGVMQWQHQFGTAGYDFAFNGAVRDDVLYVVGDVEAALPGQSAAGDSDGFVRAYDTETGTELWTNQFGTSGFDEAYSVAVDDTGVHVAGFVDGVLPGQLGHGELDGYVRKYDFTGSELYTYQFGTSGSEDVLAFTVRDGVIYVGGSTDGAFSGFTNAGLDDIYGLKIIQDTDGDNIYDDIDVDVLTPSLDFSDGTTTGSVISMGDQMLTITDAPSSSEGVKIMADVNGGANPAIISECGIATSTLTAGDSLIVTCGSVTLTIDEGSVETTLIADDGRIANTTLNAGNTITFKSDEAIVETSITNTEDTVLIIDDEITVLAPGSVDEIPTNHPVTIESTSLESAVLSLGEVTVLSAAVAAPINETSTIAGIVYSLDGGPFVSLSPNDGSYDDVTEEGAVAIGPFTSAGIHEVCVRGLDTIESPSQEACLLLAVYDPTAGYVTGGGQINSPAGAYVSNPTLTGKAHFGFVAEYETGAQTPTGNTQFRFNAGDLRFKSTSYEWLVVSGTRAQYKGYGNIGKDTGYRFMLTAVDGDALGNSGQSDKFRMRIWDDETGLVVYDNQYGDSDAANLSTDITHGSIVIHTE